jgi:putative endonuclease
MGPPHRLGALGERHAARFLEGQGYTVLARNYRFGHREIDLIARHDDTVAFVEVKTRAGDGFGHPLEAITALKRREIERVARHWLRENGGQGYSYRFDAVAVTLRAGARPRIEHVPDAWRMGD